MNNNVIESFKSQIRIEKVLEALLLEYQIKNEEAFLLCPFHNENTASFSINIEKGIFNCFGCGEKGSDIIRFIMKYKTLGFVQSLELLSELTGIPLPKGIEDIDKGELVQRKLIYMRQNFLATDVQKDFTDVYKFILDHSSKEKAVEYIASRGIPNAEYVANEMNIRILDAYDKVSGQLFKNFKPERLKNAGVINEKQNLIFYNHRLMLPFFSEDDIIYLSARTLEKDHKPKYLNLADVTIPNVYNLNAIKNNTLFICEGQTDTLSLVGLGLPAIGIAGASNVDLKSLEALSDKNVIIVFDNDTAGQNGKKKLIDILQYVANKVICYDIAEKDINEHIQSDENKEKIKKIYEEANATTASNLNR